MLQKSGKYSIREECNKNNCIYNRTTDTEKMIAVYVYINDPLSYIK